MITKSGTNKYHGSAFGFFREQQFNAENFYEKRPGGQKGPSSRQFLGGSGGGPIAKDKLFGFFAFERQREHTSISEDSLALSQLQTAQAAGLAAQPSAIIPRPFFENRYNGRLDYRFNDRETAYVSYTSQANDSLNDQSTQTGDLTEGNFTKNHLQAANFTLKVDFKDDPTLILSHPMTCGPNKNQDCYPNGFATPGAVIGMSASAGNPYFDMPGGTKQLGLFFQDDWKATSRLTLNLGVRWDKDFNLVGASAIAKSRTYLELLAINNPYAVLSHDDNHDFSPRVGFAYDLTGHAKHILRGGYGLYFGNIFQNIPLFMIQQANPTIYQGLFSLTTPTDTVPGTGIALGNWRYGVDPNPTIPPPLTSLVSGATGRLMDPKYRNPGSQQINFR